ncbi:UvrD-helicase domain-containing protein [Pseudonocardia sp. McavD-2-B]|uniref:UvrD-helicase domain-containing protein n=1 Tax=Pseudonocardia sp. McavD-2-B TaxID=2954499 RepID=UPI002097BF7A|nr:UvrD-helicase domain-containing protein [Pseudonocardia sp. McavD-2-B]MCO7191822.1 AAA family ATPase [Pseudonocardia sp. McavD-2-B]
MPTLAVGVDFLSEFGRLQKPVQKLTRDALGKFAEHTHAGLHLEKISGSRDARVRTIRIDQGWRGIVLAPEKGDRFVLLHVMPHDKANSWAKTHTVSVNEVSGVVEVRDVERLAEIADAEAVSDTADGGEQRLFAEVSDADLTRFGIDAQILAVARTIRDDEGLDAVAPIMPENQADVLRALAAGFSVEQVWSDVVAPRLAEGPVDTDDLDAAVERTLGRIALVDGPDDLLALFDKPLAMWRVFLHPSQHELAYRPTFWGSAQVTGGPGTGKTVVALHRVKHLAETRDLPPKSVLLTTYTRGLADALERDVARLLDEPQRAAVQVLNIDRWASAVVREQRGAVRIATEDELRDRMTHAAQAVGLDLGASFLLEEWRHVVLAHAVTDVDGYLSAPRRGRGRGLTRNQKHRVWEAVHRFADGLRTDGLWTHLTVADEAARLVAARPERPFRHVVVDEVQDLHPTQWRLLRAAVATGPDDLFLTGDPHQRIYGNHVSLRQMGISVGGRSTRLKVNYRTTAEILRWSMAVMSDVAVADLDEGMDSLSGYRSALHGAEPEILGARTPDDEAEELALAVEQWRIDGVSPGDVAVVCRTRRLAEKLAARLRAHGVTTAGMHETDVPAEAVRIGTMHGMKGLEFRCVAVADAGAAHLPLPVAVTDAAEDPVRHALDVQQERCLLFVACTRARERLRVSWSGTRSPLLPEVSAP